MEENTVYHYTEGYLLDPTHPITVNVIGAGGTGSLVLSDLASLHTALLALDHPGLHVRCYDDDKVSEANLGRQRFSSVELGINKAVALVTRVNRFFGLQWEAIPYRYGKNAYSKAANITITCVDTAKARLEVAARINTLKGVEQAKGYYWLDMGNMRTKGQAVLGTVGVSDKRQELPTILDLYPDLSSYDNEETQGPSCSLAEALGKQDLFINKAAALYGMQLIWHLFTKGSIQYHGAYFNLEDYKAVPIPVKQWKRTRN